MFEIEALNLNNNEIEILYGYSFEDALKRRGLDKENYKYLRSFYID